jgi:hypothetical protein
MIVLHGAIRSLTFSRLGAPINWPWNEIKLRGDRLEATQGLMRAGSYITKFGRCKFW